MESRTGVPQIDSARNDRIDICLGCSGVKSVAVNILSRDCWSLPAPPTGLMERPPRASETQFSKRLPLTDILLASVKTGSLGAAGNAGSFGHEMRCPRGPPLRASFPPLTWSADHRTRATGRYAVSFP